MKRIAALLLTASIGLAFLAGCGDSTGGSSTGLPEPPQSSTVAAPSGQVENVQSSSVQTPDIPLPKSVTISVVAGSPLEFAPKLPIISENSGDVKHFWVEYEYNHVESRKNVIMLSKDLGTSSQFANEELIEFYKEVSQHISLPAGDINGTDGKGLSIPGGYAKSTASFAFDDLKESNDLFVVEFVVTPEAQLMGATLLQFAFSDEEPVPPIEKPSSSEPPADSSELPASSSEPPAPPNENLDDPNDRTYSDWTNPNYDGETSPIQSINIGRTKSGKLVSFRIYVQRGRDYCEYFGYTGTPANQISGDLNVDNGVTYYYSISLDGDSITLTITNPRNLYRELLQSASELTTTFVPA